MNLLKTYLQIIVYIGRLSKIICTLAVTNVVINRATNEIKLRELNKIGSIETLQTLDRLVVSALIEHAKVI